MHLLKEARKDEDDEIFPCYPKSAFNCGLSVINFQFYGHKALLIVIEVEKIIRYSLSCSISPQHLSYSKLFQLECAILVY